MNEWSETQMDALIEYVNIGFGRAAAALSRLVRRRILLSAPRAYMCPLSRAFERLHTLLPPDVLYIRQAFRGGFLGQVAIILPHEHAAAMVDLLLGGSGAQRQLTSSDSEALLEVGNIVLNNFVGTLGNLLSRQMRFSMPQIHQTSLHALMTLWLDENPSSTQVILVQTRFIITGVALDGYLLVLLDSQALKVLRKAIMAQM